jgi:mannosyltransferase
MVLLDNIIFDLQKLGGITNVWKSILRAAENDSKNKYVLFSSCNGPHINNENIKTLTYKNLPFVLNRYIDIDIAKVKLMHSSYFRIHSDPNVLNVVTVHDHIYEKYDRGLRKYIHLLQKRRAVRRADVIICVSENTKNDLLEFYPEIDENNVTVIYNGVDKNVFFQIVNKNEFSNYVLFVGGRNIHKNFEFVLKFLALPTIERLDIKLIVVGGGDFTKEELVMINKYKLVNRITKKSYVTNHELNVLYNYAIALIYPSFYEGFGIPALEAMSAGCPVILSNTSSLPEVAGLSGLYVDPQRPESALDHINYIMDSEKRSGIILKGINQAEKFSWEKTGINTIELYKKIL